MVPSNCSEGEQIPCKALHFGLMLLILVVIHSTKKMPKGGKMREEEMIEVISK